MLCKPTRTPISPGPQPMYKGEPLGKFEGRTKKDQRDLTARENKQSKARAIKVAPCNRLNQLIQAKAGRRLLPPL